MTFDDQSAVYRILDASNNRASEGLRTLEELARFGLNDVPGTAELKSLRHDLTAAIGSLPRQALLRSRDTEGDVGTQLQQPSEYQRSDLLVVLQAAAARVQQSLRVLEECCKTIDPNLAADVEQIRYRSYTVCGRLETAWPQNDRVNRIAMARLYALVDAGESEDAFASHLEALCEGGVDVIQLRDRSIDDRTLIERASRGTQIANQHNVLFIMNDRTDLALAADCDGVHVGQEELPVSIARQILGSNRLIGVSTHSVDQAKQAVADGADYIGCGPVFPGRTKEFDAYVGPELLRRVSDCLSELDKSGLPAFAIGGINVSNVDQVTAAGFCRIAITGALREADDPAAAARELKGRLPDLRRGAP